MKIGKYMMAMPDGSIPEKEGPGWRIVNARSARPLGTVAWYPLWRRYVFVITPLKLVDPAIFSPDCLRDLAGFLEVMTVKRKAKEARE